jgi:peptidyl-prolyl cis-trans isomerase C
MRVVSLCIVALMGLALIFSACAKQDSRVVAQVGERTITVAQLQERFGDARPVSPEEELTRKRQVLENMIDAELMIMGAIEAELDKEDDFQAKIKEIERNALLETLYMQEIVEKSTPSEKEMKKYYEKLGWEVKASHILVKTEEEAQEIIKQLSEGGDFAELAKEKSTDRGNKDKGGDLGYFTWGKMVTPFQDTAFAMKVGSISKPVETRFGWHIIKMEDRRETQRQEYEKEKPRIEKLLGGEKTKKLSADYLTKIKEKADTQLNPEVMQVVLNNFLANKQEPEDFTDEEKAMTLVTFRGGKWTVDTFLNWIKTIPTMYRPRIKDVDDLDAMIRNVLMGELLENDARKKGLHNNKEVVNKIRQEKDKALMQMFSQKGMPTDTTVTEEDIQTYYQDHIATYTDPEKVRVREIQVDTEKEAQDILKQLRAGSDFAKLAQKKSARSWAAKKGGDLGYLDNRQYPRISEAAFKLNVGQLGGPIKDGNKYSVIKVLDKKPSSPRSLEEIKGNLKASIMRERQEESSKTWLEEMRQRKNVKIFTEVLESTVAAPEKEAA